MGSCLSTTGDLVEGRTHLDKAIALYDRAEHRPLATRFGQDVGVVILSWRSWTAWVLGYPEAALADAERASKNAREIEHAPTLIYAAVLRFLDGHPSWGLYRSKCISSRWGSKKVPRSGRQEAL